MSDEIRAELADIARRARRMIERERAGGHGELIAASVAAARAPRATAILDAAPEVAADAAPEAPAAAADSLFDQATSGGVFAGGAKGGPLNPQGLEARAEIDRAAQPVLDQIAAEVRVCEKCALSKTRHLGVPGVGSAKSGIVFVGEGPGADEDRLGEPFVGRAGQLLDKIIEAMDQAKLIPGMKLDRTTVFIGNIVHCRPPENRVPLPNEVEQSSPYLLRQLEALKPRIICCLGKTAAEALLGDKGALGSMRGRIYRFHGAKMFVTYHPAACLRNPAFKRPVWEDMQLLAREYLND
jgi:uracil-DNA glycosylase